MHHVRVKVRLEGIEVGPGPPSEELVLQMPEHLLRRAVVQAVAFARHALDEPGVLEPLDPLGVLVLPAHDALLSVKSNSRVRSAFL